MTSTPSTREARLRKIQQVLDSGWTIDRDNAVWLRAELTAAREALRQLVDRYTELVNSGDCGNWNPETEPEVQAARAALSASEEAP